MGSFVSRLWLFIIDPFISRLWPSSTRRLERVYDGLMSTLPPKPDSFCENCWRLSAELLNNQVETIIRDRKTICSYNGGRSYLISKSQLNLNAFLGCVFCKFLRRTLLVYVAMRSPQSAAPKPKDSEIIEGCKEEELLEGCEEEQEQEQEQGQEEQEEQKQKQEEQEQELLEGCEEDELLKGLKKELLERKWTSDELREWEEDALLRIRVGPFGPGEIHTGSPPNAQVFAVAINEKLVFTGVVHTSLGEFADFMRRKLNFDIINKTIPQHDISSQGTLSWTFKAHSGSSLSPGPSPSLSSSTALRRLSKSACTNTSVATKFPHLAPTLTSLRAFSTAPATPLPRTWS